MLQPHGACVKIGNLTTNESSTKEDKGVFVHYNTDMKYFELLSLNWVIIFYHPSTILYISP